MAVQTHLATTHTAHTQLPTAAQPLPVSGSREPRPSRHAATPSAGHSLTSTYELLESTLLSLPAIDVLLSQRVSKQFATVIATSPRIQQKLFLSATKPRSASADFKALLNPLLTRERARTAIPLFFDHERRRLAREWKLGFTRLVCYEVTATTVFVYLEFRDDEGLGSELAGSPLGGSSGGRECGSRTAVLKPGSWERMYLAQPSCFFHWRVRLGEGSYSGIVKGERTMGGLLEGLEEEVLVVR